MRCKRCGRFLETAKSSEAAVLDQGNPPDIAVRRVSRP